jgi:NADPH2:quinone reductase
MMVNRLTLTGSTLRPQSVENKGRMGRGLKEKVWPLLESGKVKPIIYKTFPLREAAAAHAELERGNHVGKVMLTV